MSSEWRDVSFGDFCDVTRGASPRPIHDWIADEGIPWVKISDTTSAHSRFITHTNECIRPEGRSKSVTVYPGDLILSNSATPGIPKFLGIEACIHDGWLLLRNLRHVDKLFAYYVLLNERPALVRQGTGSVFTNLRTGILKAHRVRIPELAQQQAIAAVLGSLDDKIELNRRMSETQEAIARALFNSWFVDFDPVRAKAEGRDTGLPSEITDLFPDAFEDSALGEVPKGWGVKSLDSVADFRNGLALQKFPPEGPDSLPVIKIAQLRAGNTRGADRASSALPEEYVVHQGDVLFSWSGSLECRIWTEGDGALNQHLFKVTSTTHPKWFFYLWIHQHLLHFRAIAAGKATTMGHIQRHHLTEALVTQPPAHLLEAMDRLIAPFIERSWLATLESHTLAALRDTLLPEILSGRLSVVSRQRAGQT